MGIVEGARKMFLRPPLGGVQVQVRAGARPTWREQVQSQSCRAAARCYLLLLTFAGESQPLCEEPRILQNIALLVSPISPTRAMGPRGPYKPYELYEPYEGDGPHRPL